MASPRKNFVDVLYVNIQMQKPKHKEIVIYNKI